MEKRISFPTLTGLVLFVKAYSYIILGFLFVGSDAPEDNFTPYVIVSPGGQRGESLQRARESFLHRLAPFDGQWYLDVARSGYRAISADKAQTRDVPSSNHAFFPIYPLLLRPFSSLSDFGLTACALAANLILSVIGALLLCRTAEHLGISPLPPLLLLLAYPGTAFSLFVYAEPLFLALTLGAYLTVLRSRHGVAACLGFVAGATKPQGFLISLALGLESLREKRTSPTFARVLLIILTPLAGLGAVALINRLSSDSFFTFIAVQSEWERRTDGLGLIEALGKLFRLEGNVADLTGGFLSLVSLPLILLSLPRSLAVYSLALSLLPLSTGRIISIGRFTSFDFPIFLALGAFTARRQRLLWTIVAGFSVLHILTARNLISWVFTG